MSIAGRFIALLAQHHDTPCLFTASRSGAAPDEGCGEQRVTEKRITRMHVYLPPYDLTAASVRRRSQRKMRGWVCHGPLGRHACSLLYLPHLPRPEQHNTCSAHGARSAQALIAAHGESVQGAVRVKMPAIARLPLALLPPSGAQNNARRYGRACHEAGCGGDARSIHFSGSPQPMHYPLQEQTRCVSVLWAASLSPRKCSCLDRYFLCYPKQLRAPAQPHREPATLASYERPAVASSQPGAMRGRCTKVRTGGEAATGQFLDSAAGGARKAKCIQWNACYDRSSLAHRRAQGARLARQPAPQPNQPPLPGYAYPGSSCREGGGSRDIKGALLQTPRTYSTAPYSPRQGPRF